MIRIAGATVRRIELVRGAWGAALLLAPRQVLEIVHGLRADERAVVVARVLGARHLSQAVLSGVEPSPEVLAMGVWVDGAHALTALGLAVADPSRARAGLTDTVVAAGYALAGYRDLTVGPVPSRRRDRRRDALARVVLGVVPGGGLLRRRAARRRGLRRLRSS